MTASELIKLLAELPASTPIEAWDADTDQYLAVTGVDWDTEGSVVFIQTEA